MTTLFTQNKNDYTVYLPDNVPLEVVKVEGGSFMMGSEEHDREKPVHEVNVSDFHIGKYPVTIHQQKNVCLEIRDRRIKTKRKTNFKQVSFSFLTQTPVRMLRKGTLMIS